MGDRASHKYFFVPSPGVEPALEEPPDPESNDLSVGPARHSDGVNVVATCNGRFCKLSERAGTG